MHSRTQPCQRWKRVGQNPNQTIPIALLTRAGLGRNVRGQRSSRASATHCRNVLYNEFGPTAPTNLNSNKDILRSPFHSFSVKINLFSAKNSLHHFLNGVHTCVHLALQISRRLVGLGSLPLIVATYCIMGLDELPQPRFLIWSLEFLQNVLLLF